MIVARDAAHDSMQPDFFRFYRLLHLLRITGLLRAVRGRSAEGTDDVTRQVICPCR